MTKTSSTTFDIIQKWGKNYTTKEATFDLQMKKYGEMGGDKSHMAAFSCYNTPFFSEICKGIFNVEVFGSVETRNQFVSMVLYSVL